MEIEESFNNYLSRSKDILINAGLQATMNQTEINVFVTGPEGINLNEQDPMQ